MDEEEFKEKQADKVRLDQEETRQDLGRVSSGVQGNKIDRGFVKSDYAYGPNTQYANKDSEVYQNASMVMSTQERIHAQFQQSIQDHRNFSNKAGKELNKHGEKIDQLKEELEDTVTLDNDLKVYRDGNEFHYQDAQGNWHRLENEAQIIEAIEKEQRMIAQGKTPVTKRFKENYDAYEQAYLDTAKSKEEYDRMREQFEENEQSGDYSDEELQQQEEALKEKQGELEEKLEDLNNLSGEIENRVDSNITPKQETTGFHVETGQSFFPTPAPDEPQGSGISAAEPIIKSDVQLGHDFNMAAIGEIDNQEQQPTMEPKEPSLSQPSMG